MSSPDDVSDWDRLRGRIYSKKGKWVPGVGISNHGYSMMDDLVGKVRYFQVVVLNITGRLPEVRLAQWLEAIFMCVSWPDARIWCNQIGAFAATARARPTAGVCAGILASESKMYGPGTKLPIARFLTDARLKLDAGMSPEDYIKHHGTRGGRLVVPGFARPLAAGDERVNAMHRVADELGFEIGPHLAAAHRLEAYLLERHGESLNLAGYAVAFMLDQGFVDQEIYRLASLSVSAGVQAAYVDAHAHMPWGFLPLRCDDVDYTGHAAREVPARQSGTEEDHERP